MSPWPLTLAFMDSGRMADEFEPSLRRQMRSDVLLLLVVGAALIVAGAVVILTSSLLSVAYILFSLGAALVAVAAALWISFARKRGSE